MGGCVEAGSACANGAASRRLQIGCQAKPDRKVAQARWTPVWSSRDMLMPAPGKHAALAAK